MCLWTLSASPYRWRYPFGSVVSSASSIDSIGGSFSYSTSISSHASAAASSSSAATAATGSPTNRTCSGQSACSSCETGRMPNGIGRSRPVSTATTPGCRSAREVSMRTMRACGSRDRSSLHQSMRGSDRSSAKRVSPVTLATASTLRRGVPTTERGTRTEEAASVISHSSFLVPHSLSSDLHSFINLQVPRAPTEIAAERVLDLLARGCGIDVEHRASREEKAGGAIPTLRGAELGERLLKRMELRAAGHPLDGLDVPIGVGNGQREAREDRCPVDEHGTRSAFSKLAAVLRAGESQLLSQDLE